MDRSQGLEKLWNNMFLLAKEFYVQNNHLLIPHSYIIDGVNLGAWISSQRTGYRTKTISKERKDKLNEIGMVWDVKEYQWKKMYDIAQWYYKTFGDLMVPLRYITPDGIKLGSWISQQRKNYLRIRTEKENPLFTQDKIKLLNDIEMVWDASNTIHSTSFPEQAIVYYASKLGVKFKNRVQYAGVEIDVLFPELNIGIEYDGERWHKDVQRDIEKCEVCKAEGLKLIRIREPQCPKIAGVKAYVLSGYAHSDLSSVISDVFSEELGINIAVDVAADYNRIIEQYVIYSKQRWKEMITILMAYKNEYGNIQVPRDVVIDGYYIGSWIHDIRKRNKNNLLFISKSQRKQLDDLGMVWDMYEKTWNEMYIGAKQYYCLHGNLKVPVGYKLKNGNNLFYWLSEQRKRYTKGTLSKEYCDLLNELNFDWNPIGNRWEYMYSLAKQYYQENGNLLIPARYNANGEKLGNWLMVQRKKYIHPTPSTGRLTKKQICKLEKLEMVWDVNESQWQEMLNLCRQYKDNYGDLRVNRNYIVDGIKLGVWIGQQRVRYNRNDGSISKEHIQSLDSLGMIWNEMGEKWLDSYMLAKKYYIEYGTVNIPQKTKYNGKAIGRWLYNQKKKAKNNLLQDDQIKLLKELQLVW